jgi:Ca-activated chloride channel family protein
MARVGMGEPFVITKPEETREKAEKFRKMIESPVLINVRINFGKFDAYDAEPISIPDVFAERPVIVFGKWRGKPMGEIRLKGTMSSGPYLNKIEIGGEKPLKTNSSLQYLWARHRIAVLSDYNFLHQDAERIKEVTRLGLTYNLLTAYTSFGAIDSEVRVTNGQSTTVKQPLPLPEGVSDYAVGNRMFAKSAKRAASPIAYLGDFSVAEKSPMREEYKSERLMQASIDLGEISTTGRLSKEAIQKVIRTQISSMESCYQSALKRRSDLKGEVVLQITVDSNGRVSKVSLVSSKINDKLLEQFIIQKMKELNFPPSGSLEKVIISLLLKLKAS